MEIDLNPSVCHNGNGQVERTASRFAIARHKTHGHWHAHQVGTCFPGSRKTESLSGNNLSYQPHDGQKMFRPRKQTFFALGLEKNLAFFLDIPSFWIAVRRSSLDTSILKTSLIMDFKRCNEMNGFAWMLALIVSTTTRPFLVPFLWDGYFDRSGFRSHLHTVLWLTWRIFAVFLRLENRLFTCEANFLIPIGYIPY